MTDSPSIPHITPESLMGSDTSNTDRIPTETSLFITVGRVLRPHGVRGAMKIQSFMNPNSNIMELKDFVIQDQVWSAWVHCHTTGSNNIFIASLEGINRPETIQTWKQAPILIHRSSLPHDPDAVYHVDWWGKQVVDCHGIVVGSVVNVHDFGAGAVLELQDGRMFSYRSVVDISANILTLQFAANLM